MLFKLPSYNILCDCAVWWEREQVLLTQVCDQILQRIQYSQVCCSDVDRCFEEPLTLNDVKTQLADGLSDVIKDVIRQLRIAIPDFSPTQNFKATRFENTDIDDDQQTASDLVEQCYQAGTRGNFREL
jgi:hypothetical protein